MTDSDRLAVIESIVTRMDLHLFGDDGQGGKLNSFENRITKLENWRWWVVGIAVGLGMALGGVGQKLIAAVLK